VPATVLIDNGSSRAESTLALRALALDLGRRLGEPVHPVSLLHADRVPAGSLGGRPADTLEPYLRRARSAGVRDFRLVPLWFGPSHALTRTIPAVAAAVRSDCGPFQLRVAPPLCPLPGGEPRLVEILLERIGAVAAEQVIVPRRLVLVDHGSPSPQVGAVRTWLGERLRERVGPGAVVQEAAMERRAGPEYDFNGDLLATVLRRLATEDPRTAVILVMLFLTPGRHAGRAGDIAAVCAEVESAVPGFRAHATAPLGTHPALVEILAERAAAV
jgi:sirohydrochlorin ferrochelatase